MQFYILVSNHEMNSGKLAKPGILDFDQGTDLAGMWALLSKCQISDTSRATMCWISIVTKSVPASWMKTDRALKGFTSGFKNRLYGSADVGEECRIASEEPEFSLLF